MRQRVGIAMALALRPEIVVMDEPTTALDVVVQREILLEVARLRRDLGFSVIFITHDLPMLVDLSDRIAVMYAGEIVERAPRHWWAAAPPTPIPTACRQPARTSLVSGGNCADPRLTTRPAPGDHRLRLRPPLPVRVRALRRREAGPAARPGFLRPASAGRRRQRPWPGRRAWCAGRAGAGDWAVACHLHDRSFRPGGPPGELAGPAGGAGDGAHVGNTSGARLAGGVGATMSVLEVRDLTVDFAQRNGPKFRAVDHVSFELVAGETLALVGESGSGKSTIARALARLIPPSEGQLLLRGQPVGRRGRRLRDYRREVQMVLQDPFASLNPAFTVGHHLRRPLRIFGHPRAGLGQEVESLLASVNLVPAGQFVPKYPHELSGGQRQRVAIARALATQPEVVLADEPVSMLDVSIRLEILNLLDGLKRDRNLALLYITHDLATAAPLLEQDHGDVQGRDR